MFLIGNILSSLITELEFTQLKWILIYGSKHGKYWFSQFFFYNNFKTIVSTEIKLWFFWIPRNNSNQIHLIPFLKLLFFLRKYTKSSIIRSNGAVPLSVFSWHVCVLIMHSFILAVKERRWEVVREPSSN